MANIVKIISYGYRPGTAWTNRNIAYAKALIQFGYKVVFVFLIPDKTRSKMDLHLNNLECIYLWENDGCLCRRNNVLSYIKNRFKIIKHIHDGDICFFSDASGFFLHELKLARKKVKIIFESTEHPEAFNRRFNKKIALAYFYYKLKRAHEILVISHSLKDFYISKGFDSKHITVSNMFVDSSRFHDLTKTSNNRYIAYCGSISRKKDGVDLLIKSFANFLQIYPNYTLEIYGTGPENEIRYLNELCIQLGVKSCVKFCGKISYEDMPQKLYNASILALSRPNNQQNQHGFPTKLGEYLATGNPVVVTSVGEIPRFIVDGKNGYLAKPDDVDSFSQKLLLAARDLDRGYNVGESGKELVESVFSSIVQVKQLSFVFNNTL